MSKAEHKFKYKIDTGIVHDVVLNMLAKQFNPDEQSFT